MKYDDWKILGNEYEKYCKKCEVDLREYYDQPNEINENDMCVDCLNEDDESIILIIPELECKYCLKPYMEQFRDEYKNWAGDPYKFRYFNGCDKCYTLEKIKAIKRYQMLKTVNKICERCEEELTLDNFKEFHGKYGKFWSKICKGCFWSFQNFKKYGI